MAEEWSNWSGSVRARPARIAAPHTEDELAAIVRRAAKVRAVGAGHSFMPLCETDGTLVHLARLDSPIDIAQDGCSAWAPAGWSLKRLTQALWEQGYSLPNQGDVNPQSLAGAIATGTHGTGAALGSLATFARAFRLMLADGSVIECSENERPELFQAARLSLGLLGIATRVRVQVMPAIHLQEQVRKMPFAALIERFDEIATSNRHAEFFLFPYSDDAILKILHPAPDDGSFREPPAGEETIFRYCCEVGAAFPSMTGPLQRLMTRFVGGSRRVGAAYRIFPSDRTVPFEEMEYEMPRAAGLSTLQELIGWIRKRRLPVTFPFEFRWVAGDDIWLSPFNNGPGASISLHQYSKMPWHRLFAEAEPVFREHGGRPHWAKRHTLGPKDVFDLYPKARKFLAVRSEVDPYAKFANAPLTELFDIAPGAWSAENAG
jgi:FAD-linked oxidoreductase